MKCPECESKDIKKDVYCGNKQFFQCNKCRALFQRCSETPTLLYFNKKRGVSQNKKKTKTAKMTDFKYLGKKSEDFIEKYVEIPLQYDAKFELNEILKEMFERSKEVFKEKVF